MKFISVIALLAPVVLATPQATNDRPLTRLLEENCPDMPQQCVDIAKKVHQPLSHIAQVIQAMPTCIPAYGKCIQGLSGSLDIPQQDTTPEGLVQCLLQIPSDNIKYFLDNEKADIPIPAGQNCALRELHRLAHVELGPLA
ncbi:hypothetical protein P875_00010014 [Aspergillus parasiticus SU-1]|uniref:Uncharacterized protein n=1 Tax=Aspergillus parasiticus (strain ATCC 56775 / NRRL 5862 / SRRC 143 / SU-1) TaxID=1403190 RepID=A0A0F0ID07_ASPPU|nr:hypothetical protein P875_00010014 [Aspergillus parasiticus SU-1]